MGTGEESTATKPSKLAASTQESQTTQPYHDWSSSMQAYYGAGATAAPFFASTVASPTPHPYMWGSQHPLIPPYGTPVPYPAMYPPAGVYAHPNVAMTANLAQTSVELEGKNSDGKERALSKKSKANSVSSAAKAGESGKATSGSGNDGPSQSAESGSEDSSEGSDENANPQAASRKGSFNQMLADGANAQGSIGGALVPASVGGKPVVSTPPTNLNIGMDLWNASSAAGTANMRPNPPGPSSVVAPGTATPEQWIQDERELKRQKRKQSNRESARRSRLRKQAECEELQNRVEALTNENQALREELQKMSEEHDQLKSENDSLKEEIIQVYGPEAAAKLEQDASPAPAVQPRNGEGS